MTRGEKDAAGMQHDARKMQMSHATGVGGDSEAAGSGKRKLPGNLCQLSA